MVVAALLACAPVLAAPSAEADEGPRLPEVVNAPGTWSDGVELEGPIAAVGIATRTTPVGLLDDRERLSYFMTSAVDGRSTWLELPGLSLDSWGFVGGVAVSPDGRWLGWVRVTEGAGPPKRTAGIMAGSGTGTIAGWSVVDTTTGVVRELRVPGHRRVRPTLADLAFSGDSRYLLTSFETPDQPRRGTRGHQFVAWDVADGTPTVLEEPGMYWLPSLGSAEHGVVWSRKGEVFRADPATGERATTTLPHTVLMASWAPGDAAFAYIGRDDRASGRGSGDETLYVGPTPATADRAIDLPDTSSIGEFLAWRDADHVVVGDYRSGVYVVDVRDGSFESLDLAGSGDQVNSPVLATGLWSEPLGEAAAPTGATDPRQPWRRAGLVAGLLVLAGAGAALWRRRASLSPARRRPPGELRPG